VEGGKARSSNILKAMCADESEQAAPSYGALDAARNCNQYSSYGETLGCHAEHDQFYLLEAHFGSTCWKIC
jgi:hypothetical protein